MWQIYLLDISQNIKALGASLSLASLIFAVIGVVVMINSDDWSRDHIKFKEGRTISGYLFISSVVLIFIGILMTTLTPSQETSKYLIDEIKAEIIKK